MKTPLFTAVVLAMTISTGAATADSSRLTLPKMKLVPMAQVLVPVKTSETCNIRWVKPPTPEERAAAEASCKREKLRKVKPSAELSLIRW